jgi:hypothetical protein
MFYRTIYHLLEVGTKMEINKIDTDWMYIMEWWFHRNQTLWQNLWTGIYASLMWYMITFNILTSRKGQAHLCTKHYLVNVWSTVFAMTPNGGGILSWWLCCLNRKILGFSSAETVICMVESELQSENFQNFHRQIQEKTVQEIPDVTMKSSHATELGAWCLLIPGSTSSSPWFSNILFP